MLQVVAKVLAKLGREADGEENTVHRIIMNPKAMTINQMYGFFDELNEWNDGILATTYRFRNKLFINHFFLLQELFQHVAKGVEMVDFRRPSELVLRNTKKFGSQVEMLKTVTRLILNGSRT